MQVEEQVVITRLVDQYIVTALHQVAHHQVQRMATAAGQHDLFRVRSNARVCQFLSQLGP
ncbi:hypothetical protein D3C72_2221920 [compost metagenome]